jgi:hypothetical protein
LYSESKKNESIGLNSESDKDDSDDELYRPSPLRGEKDSSPLISEGERE